MTVAGIYVLMNGAPKATGAASIGGIVRGHGGCVILFFWVSCGMGKKTYDPLILEELDCASMVASLAVQQEERYLNTFCSQRCCSREYNRVAYEFAELAKRTVHCAVWRENAPSCVTELLKSDCSSLCD
ncbi:hypothetical protein GQ55_2G043100 [Panicum hallii var. hallii]|uniref:RNase H type-1 domain-containing protein n=1 Tax=Panicum hallii var. hallii TaxID=1504633 RepID=A0A2T7ELC0_9POAL|nr:hypothetical protein GQ55_2G043100 [Panicum hallii var. hallii]